MDSFGGSIVRQLCNEETFFTCLKGGGGGGGVCSMCLREEFKACLTFGASIG